MDTNNWLDNSKQQNQIKWKKSTVWENSDNMYLGYTRPPSKKIKINWNILCCCFKRKDNQDIYNTDNSDIFRDTKPNNIIYTDDYIVL